MFELRAEQEVPRQISIDLSSHHALPEELKACNVIEWDKSSLDMLI